MLTTDTDFLVRMPDGTLKQVNPFSGTQVWTVPGRANRPTDQADDSGKVAISAAGSDNACPFCPGCYEKTPPEKSRLVLASPDEYRMHQYVPAEKLHDTVAEFRRIPNLFEIISYDYWVQNYNYHLPRQIEEWRDAYLSDPAGHEHVLQIVDHKLKLQGRSPDEIRHMGESEKLDIANSFFAGGHELIVPRRHYAEGAEYTCEKASSGTLTPDEHYRYMLFTIDAVRDIYKNNRYVRYVTVYQNWLKPAGASFDHLHKQLVAVDGRSAANDREFDLVRTRPNAYNDFAVNYAYYHNLVFAENEHAIAFADFGHRFPSLAIYSKSRRNQPWNHSPAEIRGMSDLIHGCHAAMGHHIPCNEEWYYRPPDVDVSVPWHVLIKWRVNTPAGFEAVTKIYVNTIEPALLRGRIVPPMRELRELGRIAAFDIGDECRTCPNCLLYNPMLQQKAYYAQPVAGDDLLTFET